MKIVIFVVDVFFFVAVVAAQTLMEEFYRSRWDAEGKEWCELNVWIQTRFESLMLSGRRKSSCLAHINICRSCWTENIIDSRAITNARFAFEAKQRKAQQQQLKIPSHTYSTLVSKPSIWIFQCFMFTKCTFARRFDCVVYTMA